MGIVKKTQIFSFIIDSYSNDILSHLPSLIINQLVVYLFICSTRNSQLATHLWNHGMRQLKLFIVSTMVGDILFPFLHII